MNFRRVELAFAVLALFYMSGAAVTLLTPEGGGGGDGAPAYRAIGLVVGTIVIALMGLIPNSLDRVLRHYWPVLILTGLVLTSSLWSPYPDLAMRRSSALAFTVAFGIYLGERFDRRTLFNLLLAGTFVTSAACYVAIIAFPEFGVHQLEEPISGFAGVRPPNHPDAGRDSAVAHAGAWRGLFPHKNDFGRYSALTALLFLIASLIRRKGRAFYIAALILAVIAVLQSRASQAILLVVATGSLLLFVFWLRTLDAKRRATTLLLLTPVLLVSLLLWQAIFGAVLGLLGKDESLTGRTEIWALVIEGLHGHYLLGSGYGTGMLLVRPLLAEEIKNLIGHAHNGYLNLLADIGLVGLGLGLAIFAGVMARSYSRFFVGRPSEVAALGIGFSTFLLLGNVVGSFLFAYNSIYCVLLVMLSGLLRRRSAYPIAGSRAGERSKPAVS